MKPRDCRHVHFIQAIKGSSVVKILSTHGSPAIKFKELEDIYKFEDAMNLGSSSTFKRQEAGFMDRSCDHPEVHNEMHTVVRSVKREPETYDLDNDGGDVKCNSDSDELRFIAMTLEELKHRCKRKKRKIPKLDDSKELKGRSKSKKRKLENLDDLMQESQTCSLGALSCGGQDEKVQSKEDDDFNKPLILLKVKRSKKSKNRNAHGASLTCAVSNSTVLAETITAKHSLQPIGEHGPIHIKSEIFELDDLDTHNAPMTGISTFGSCLEMISCKDHEMPEGVARSELEMKELTSCAEAISCCVNEVSYEYLDHDKSSISGMTNHKSKVSELDDTDTENTHMTDAFTSGSCLEMISCREYEMPETRSELEMEELTFCAEATSFCVNEVSHEYVDHDESSISGMTSHKSIPSHVSEHLMKGNTIESLSFYSTFEAVPNINDSSSEIYFSHASDSSRQGEIPCLTGTMTQINDMAINDILQCTELNHGGNAGLYNMDNEDNRKEDPPSNSRHNVHTFAGVNGEFKCSEGAHSSCSTDWLKDVGQDNHLGMKMATLPKRIFSTRKVISPTSQEKLRRAVDVEELYAKIRTSGLRGRICFQNLTKSEDSSKLDIEEAAIPVSSDRKVKKLINNKNKSPQEVLKGILKDPNVSSETPYTRKEPSSIYSCAQSAMKFSQRQMGDIENLVMKLTKELKSMTEIVEEILCPEACLSTSSKYTADEIRAAINDAIGIQETTTKWLSIMSRDTNRFCKIMKSTAKKAAHASSNGIDKDKKKLTFADEVGRTLCHVKVIDDPCESSLASESHESLILSPHKQTYLYTMY